jgi:hypothetical protein
MNRPTKSQAIQCAIDRILKELFRKKAADAFGKYSAQNRDGREELKSPDNGDEATGRPSGRDPRCPQRVSWNNIEAGDPTSSENSAPKTKPRDPRYPPRLRYIPNTGANCPKCGSKAPKADNGRPYCRRCGPFPIRKPSDE